MGPFEYLLIFASVILGLAACELAIGLNRLLGAWERIAWDPRPPLAALLTFLKLVTQWWTWHAAAPMASGITFEMYLAVLADAFLLFMLAAAALPNEAGGEASLDLAVHYSRVSRRFWILFTLHFLLALATIVWIQAAVEHARLTPVTLLLPVPVTLVGLGLIVVRNRTWHIVGLTAFCLLYLFQFFGHTLPS